MAAEEEKNKAQEEMIGEREGKKTLFHTFQTPYV